MFYTYLWLRAKDGTFPATTPYYVGKGRGNRAYEDADHCVHPPTDLSLIVIFPCQSEQEAFDEEKRLIALHGRIDLGTGCLRNRTAGGEGISGYKFQEHSLKVMSTKRKAWTEANPEKVKANIARLAVINQGRVPHNKGKKQSDETRLKMRESSQHKAWNKGKLLSEDHCKAISEGLKGNKHLLGFHHTEESRKKIADSFMKMSVAQRLKGKREGAHLRWHVKRDIISPTCPFCRKPPITT